MRLIASAEPVQGRIHAAIAIAMQPGSHTYWKDPGDAGVPPVFAFNGSKNVAASEVLFPVPTRIEEEGLEAFGYKDEVVFPVLVTPAKAAAPAALHVEIAYAVCNRICIPATARADLPLPPTGAARDDARVALAFASVPAPLPAARTADLTLARVEGAKPTWTVAWHGAVPLADVFAEAPEGFAFDTHKSAAPGQWTLVATQVVKGPGQSKVPVSLTLAGTDGSFVTTETLDLAQPQK